MANKFLGIGGRDYVANVGRIYRNDDSETTLHSGI